MSVSNEKEPVWIWDKNIQTYLNNFCITESTKVLVDCTPIIVLLHKNRQYFRDIDKIETVSRRCCLYTFRSDVFRRVASYLEVLLSDHYLRKKDSILIRRGKISMQMLEFIVTEYSNDFKLIQTISDFFGERNVFIVHLKEFNEKKNELYNFLGLSYVENNLEHEKNPVQFENTVNYLNYLKGLSVVRKYMSQNESRIYRIIEKSKEDMLKHYGIE